MFKVLSKISHFSAIAVVVAMIGAALVVAVPQTALAVGCDTSSPRDGVSDGDQPDDAACATAGGSPVTTGTSKDAICEGVGFAGGGGNCGTGDPQGAVSGIVGTAINLISIVVGVISVIMIIIGGLKYIMSSGDSNNINSAKNTILYAIIGLVVVAFAQIIVRFVLTKI